MLLLSLVSSLRQLGGGGAAAADVPDAGAVGTAVAVAVVVVPAADAVCSTDGCQEHAAAGVVAVAVAVAVVVVADVAVAVVDVGCCRAWSTITMSTATTSQRHTHKHISILRRVTSVAIVSAQDCIMFVRVAVAAVGKVSVSGLFHGLASCIAAFRNFELCPFQWGAQI